MNRKQLAKQILAGETPEGVALHGNGYKTYCTTSVLGFYGINKNEFKFCQTVRDMVRILGRHGFSSKRVNKKLIKNRVANIGALPVGFYLIFVNGHVSLVYVMGGGKYNFVVDTAPTVTQTAYLISVKRIGRK